MPPPELNPYAAPRTDASESLPELVAMDDAILGDLRSDSATMYRFGMLFFATTPVGVLPLLDHVYSGSLPRYPKIAAAFVLASLFCSLLGLIIGQAYVRRPPWGRAVVLTLCSGWRGHGRWLGLEYGRRSWGRGFDRLFGPDRLQHRDIEREYRRRQAARKPA